jgi:hypothetical protein
MSMMYIPEEDAATIPPEQVAALIQSGALAPNQPGLQTAPVVQGNQETTTEITNEPVESEAERIARLDREELARQFNASQRVQEAQTQQNRANAFARLRALLDRVGLGALESNVRDLIARGVTDDNTILFELRETETFKTRFKANVARAKKGLPELDPSTYVGLEQSFRETLRSNNLPIGFYDETDDFAKFIEGDVSPAELQDRIQQGYRKVLDADPEVKRQMQQLYNVGEQELAAYFIDPDRGVVALKRQAEAAKIAARAKEQAGFQLTALSAEDLTARGYTPDEAQAAFTKAGQLAGLYTEMGGEEALTEAQKIGAAFGYDVAAAQALEQRKRARLGEFQGGGGFAKTTGATSGTVETGVGEAQ